MSAELAVLILLLSVGFGAGLGYLIYLLNTCPDGWEDEEGFHEGER